LTVIFSVFILARKDDGIRAFSTISGNACSSWSVNAGV
jgi:hypothetical protein